MIFDSPTFVRGSDGNIYELRGNNNTAGGIFLMIIMVVWAIVQGVMAVYNWFLTHYAWTALISVFCFITWVGWVHFEHQQGETWKRIFKKVFFLIVVLAGFSIASTGFTQARHQNRLLRDAQGQWAKVDEPVSVLIEDGQFILQHEDSLYVLETIYEPKYHSPEIITLSLTGEYRQPNKQGAAPETYQNTVHYSLRKDTLLLWMPDNTEPYAFLKMEGLPKVKESK